MIHFILAIASWVLIHKAITRGLDDVDASVTGSMMGAIFFVVSGFSYLIGDWWSLIGYLLFAISLTAYFQPAIDAWKESEKYERIDSKPACSTVDKEIEWLRRLAKNNTKLPVKSRTKKKRESVRGNNLDTVRFDYINADDEYSSRRVVVRQLSEDYFTGLDLDINETRTFRLERVIGSITSEKSGEIFSPGAWAASIQAS